MKQLRITVGHKTYDVTVEVLKDTDARPGTGEFRPASVVAPVPPSSQGTPISPAAAGPGTVVCPITGLLKAILVQQGDQVEAGKVLAILEAMKMENPIPATRAGTIKSVNVKEGETAHEGQALFVIE
jgi:glutaconyl-CoA/methylmalonyl-CoA decarboxylase subunit gamma